MDGINIQNGSGGRTSINLSLFNDRLLSAFDEWIEYHREHIGGGWYSAFKKELKKMRKNDVSGPADIVARALYIFNMISNLGVMAGITKDGVQLQCITNPNIDRKRTMRLLYLCSSCIALQHLLYLTSGGG